MPICTKNKRKWRSPKLFSAVVFATMLWCSSQPSLAYSANKVSFEARPNGIFRVYVNYTVPALKEFRDAFVEFYDRKQAEAFYYDLLNGAEFYPDKAERREFPETPKQPRPW